MHAPACEIYCVHTNEHGDVTAADDGADAGRVAYDVGDGRVPSDARQRKDVNRRVGQHKVERLGVVDAFGSCVVSKINN